MKSATRPAPIIAKPRRPCTPFLTLEGRTRVEIASSRLLYSQTKSLDGRMKFFVINLDRCPERLARFQQSTHFFRDFERFPAVDGATVSRRQLLATGDLGEGLTYGDGALGCALSQTRRAEGSP